MALIVTCKDEDNTLEALEQISRAIENHRVPDWEKNKSNNFQCTTGEFKRKASFRPSIINNKIFFGLVNPTESPYSVPQDIYERYHAMFYNVLVHFSWLYYFIVEETPDRVENIDSRVVE
jgi:hypothetical protein